MLFNQMSLLIKCKCLIIILNTVDCDIFYRLIEYKNTIIRISQMTAAIPPLAPLIWNFHWTNCRSIAKPSPQLQISSPYSAFTIVILRFMCPRGHCQNGIRTFAAALSWCTFLPCHAHWTRGAPGRRSVRSVVAVATLPSCRCFCCFTHLNSCNENALKCSCNCFCSCHCHSYSHCHAHANAHCHVPTPGSGAAVAFISVILSRYPCALHAMRASQRKSHLAFPSLSQCSSTPRIIVVHNLHSS